jgi:multidrug efflux pump subunit AcrA (membrane-fusion protein)
VIAAVVIIGLVGVVAGSRGFTSLVGTPSTSDAITYRASRGDLLLTITEDGDLESASNMDVKCEVAGGSTILWIVEDGKQVKKDEVIVRLDDSILIDEVNAQRILYEKARAAKIQAEETHAAATIAVNEYVEGTYVSTVQTQEAAITIAMDNLRSAENVLQYTERMARKGYVTPLQLEAQRFAVERAKLELETAKTTLRVLTDYTKEKMTRELQSLRDAAEAAARAETASFELEKGRLERLETQLEKCVIRAPQHGMVIYANDRSRRRSNEEEDIQEGAAVRDQQVLIRLPDLTQMQAKVAVHESKVDQLKPGMRATVRIQDRVVEGAVTSVATQPEPTGWFSPNLKEYATIVKIDGQPSGLKPGMTAEVTILADHLKDVLTVPVQCVVEQADEFYCWVETPGGPERRPVILGASNNRMIEVKDGVLEGELALLNPRALLDEAREENPFGESPRDKADDEDRDGDAPARSTGADGSASRESADQPKSKEARGEEPKSAAPANETAVGGS